MPTSLTLIRALTCVFVTALNPISPGPAAADRPLPAGTVPDAPRILTLDRAQVLARASNPWLGSAEERLNAAEGRALDAGRRPNPGLEVSLENWGGSLGSRITESTLGVSQPIELGGDRRARANLAGSEVAGERADLRLARRALMADVTEDFLAAWTAQERLAQLRASRQLAADAVLAAADRHRAGAASAVERIRAEGNLAMTEAELERARAGLSVASRALALRWGSADVSFDSLALPAPDLDAAPAPDLAVARVRAHPEVARAEADVRMSGARRQLVRASRVPDPELRLGLRDLREAGGAGFVAGLSVPLPIWDTHRGALVAAGADESSARHVARGTEQRMIVAVRSVIDRLEASIGAYGRLRDGAAPAADEALSALREGYRVGRLAYVDLVEGQRAALEARLALIDAGADVWRARAELARLVGDATDETEIEVTR